MMESSQAYIAEMHVVLDTNAIHTNSPLELVSLPAKTAFQRVPGDISVTWYLPTGPSLN